MMDNYMIGLVFLFIAILIARIINEKATKKLEQDKKAALIDVFSKDRIWTIAVLIAIMVLFFISLRFDLIDPFWAYLMYMVCLVAYVFIIAYNSYKKLKVNGFPDAYIKSYIISTSLRIVGLVLFVALIGF